MIFKAFPTQTILRFCIIQLLSCCQDILKSLYPTYGDS